MINVRISSQVIVISGTVAEQRIVQLELNRLIETS